MNTHIYNLSLEWTGNKGSGTSGYNDYDRDYFIKGENKEEIKGSSDPTYRGDKNRYNPEELLVASLSSCHMLWYLHLCAVAGVIVTQYTDNAKGIMIETTNGGGRFSEVTLHPVIMVSEKSMIDKANELHKKAHELCFIANSVNFPVKHEVTCKINNPSKEI